MEKMSYDQHYARRGSLRRARKRLKAAIKIQSSGLAGEFYGVLAGTIYSFLADKMLRTAAGLTLREVVQELEVRNVDNELIKRLTTLLETCDAARFAPSDFPVEERKKSLQSAEDIIIALERVLK